MKNVVFYHAACPDGAVAAAIAYRALKERGETDIDLVPAKYQHPLEEYVTPERVVGAAVYILDFSFSPEEISRLSAMVGVNGKIVALDHHKSAMEKYEQTFSAPIRDGVMGIMDFNVSLTFNMNHSGAALAWMHFYPTAPLPALIAHVEDYDLWRHALPDSKAVHAFLRSLDMDVMKYVELIDSGERVTAAGEDPMKMLSLIGGYILSANDQQAKALANHPETVVFGGLTALAVNAPLHQDDIGSTLAAQCESGVGVMWYWREGRYKVSMRSRSVDGREPFDCSALAKQYGGGGHRGAASFTCAMLPWRECG